MPRARINSEESEAVLLKPRVRKPRVSLVNSENTPAPRKRVTQRSRITSTEIAPPARRAPTPLAIRQRHRSRNSKMLLIVLVICFVIAGAGIGIGFLDRGEINVIAVVNERNEKINKGEVRDAAGQTVTQTIQVQNGDTRPNGGLPMGDLVAPPPVPDPEPVATSTGTASSTPDTTPTSTSSDVAAPPAG